MGWGVRGGVATPCWTWAGICQRAQLGVSMGQQKSTAPSQVEEGHDRGGEGAPSSGQAARTRPPQLSGVSWGRTLKGPRGHLGGGEKGGGTRSEGRAPWWREELKKHQDCFRKPKILQGPASCLRKKCPPVRDQRDEVSPYCGKL